MTDTSLTHPEIRESVAALCRDFPGEYWREKDSNDAYPTEFVQALTEAGFLACLIPEEYGGSGLGLSEASAIMEEIHKLHDNYGFRSEISENHVYFYL